LAQGVEEARRSVVLELLRGDDLGVRRHLVATDLTRGGGPLNRRDRCGRSRCGRGRCRGCCRSGDRCPGAGCRTASSRFGTGGARRAHRRGRRDAPRRAAGARKRRRRNHVDVRKCRLGVRSRRRQQRRGNRPERIPARPSRISALPRIPILHNTPPAYHRPNARMMLDISRLVARIICQIRSGTFGKRAKLTFAF
jgi:hypothetical protein